MPLTTAERINAFLKIPIETDPRLREQGFGGGGTQNHPTDPNRGSAGSYGADKRRLEFYPPGGENRKSVLARSQRALQEAFDRWPGENVLVVTHEGVIKSLVYHLSGRKFLPTEPPLLKSYQLHRLVHDRDGLRLEAANALAPAAI